MQNFTTLLLVIMLNETILEYMLGVIMLDIIRLTVIFLNDIILAVVYNMSFGRVSLC